MRLNLASWSLQARLLWGAGGLLLLFAVLTAVALEQAFAETARAAREERLRGQLYLLLGSVELDVQAQPVLPLSSVEPRLDLPHSGLYAQILAAGKPAWRSVSAQGVALPPLAPLVPGGHAFQEISQDSVHYFQYAMGVVWSQDQRSTNLTLAVSEDRRGYATELARFRHTLWGWLAALTLLLLLALLLGVRMGLAPLRRMARQIQAIHSGEQRRLDPDYPEELRGLSDNLNQLLSHEEAQRQRHRHALDDLSHSLKTPLAVLRSSDEDDPQQWRAVVREQVARMDQIVQYQLQRAVLAGQGALGQRSQPLRPWVDQVVRGLQKVYADKNLSWEVVVSEHATWQVDPSDALECLGNLLDNACKWARSQVSISLEQHGPHLLLLVQDDGPGFPSGTPERVLERGIRLDEAMPGTGFGLSLVRDIVQEYQGVLWLDNAPQGGARVGCGLPGQLPGA